MRGYGVQDRARWVREPPKNPQRGPFERDRARVLHSSALRRLAAKTQVVGPASGDFARNRLTHSLEVAQVGRELGSALGCDPDVVDTACLAHDLGHPPFGHNGESVLSQVAADIGGFEGNAQTLRLLTRLEPKVLHPDDGGPGPPRPAGLNLTRASLDAVTKYPWTRGAGPQQTAKYGVYADDLAVFTWLREGAPDGRRCLEAQVMDFADDVAYCVHDVEDAVVGGYLDLARIPADRDAVQAVCSIAGAWYLPDAGAEEVREALDRLVAAPLWVRGFDGGHRDLAALKDMTSQLIGRFCHSAQQATRKLHGPGRLVRFDADLVLPRQTAVEIATMKALAAVFVMTVEDRQPEYLYQRELLAELVAVLRERAPEALEPTFVEDWRAAPGDAGRLRVLVDQVASLTDVSAVAWHDRLVGAPSRRGRGGAGGPGGGAGGPVGTAPVAPGLPSAQPGSIQPPGSHLDSPGEPDPQR